MVNGSQDSGETISLVSCSALLSFKAEGLARGTGGKDIKGGQVSDCGDDSDIWHDSGVGESLKEDIPTEFVTLAQSKDLKYSKIGSGERESGSDSTAQVKLGEHGSIAIARSLTLNLFPLEFPLLWSGGVSSHPSVSRS